MVPRAPATLQSPPANPCQSPRQCHPRSWLQTACCRLPRAKSRAAHDRRRWSSSARMSSRSAPAPHRSAGRAHRVAFRQVKIEVPPARRSSRPRRFRRPQPRAPFRSLANSRALPRPKRSGKRLYSCMADSSRLLDIEDAVDADVFQRLHAPTRPMNDYSVDNSHRAQAEVQSAVVLRKES